MAVGERLGHGEQHVAVGVVGDLGRRGPGQHGDGRHRARCRAELLDQPGQPVHADSRQARTAQDGEDIARGDAAGQALRQLAVVDRLAAEVALHEAVVADDDALDELFVHLVLLVDELVGDGALMARRGDGPVDGRVRRRGVVVGGRVAQQVDDPVEVGFGADGQFDRRHPGAEAGADVGQGAIEVRPFAIQLVDDDHPGQAQPGRGAPGVFGLGLDAVGGADDHDGQVGAGQGRQHFGGEVRVAGSVEQVHLHPVHRDRCQGGGDGQMARDLLGLEITGRGPFFHGAPAGQGAGRRQEGFGEGRLAGAVMADEGDVSDCGRVVWHWSLRPCCTGVAVAVA